MCFSILVFGQNATQLQTRSIPPQFPVYYSTYITKNPIIFPSPHPLSIYTHLTGENSPPPPPFDIWFGLLRFRNHSPPPLSILRPPSLRLPRKEKAFGGRGRRTRRTQQQKQGRLSEGKERMTRGGKGELLLFFSRLEAARVHLLRVGIHPAGMCFQCMFRTEVYYRGGNECRANPKNIVPWH